jgi:enterobactin synthetase component D
MHTPARNPALFPPFVLQHSVLFEPEDATDLARQFPGLVLPPSLEGAVRKRQTEFLAGRYCAREALRECAPEHADALIGTGKHREPLWPPGIVGSISHAHGFASVAVARAEHVRGLGLDVEQVMREDLAARVTGTISLPGELPALVEQTGWERTMALTLVFSAKESLFKCLYPQVGRYFDFQDARLVTVEPATGRFTARLESTLTPALARGSLFEGRFELRDTQVCTALVCLP